MVLKKLLREPLLYFLAIGALLFVIFHVFAKSEQSKPESVLITRKQVDIAASIFERTWQHAPTPEERQQLVEGLIRDEIFYREGMALGLDRDDPLIRRRVKLKLELLAEEEQAPGDPTDRELQAYLDAHPDRFAIHPRLSFRQIYLRPGTRDSGGRSARLLGELTRLGDSDEAAMKGDPIQLAHRVEDMPAPDVARDFGDSFAAALTQLPAGQWTGPIPSAYGMHLVLVSRTDARRAPALAEVRLAVEREWTREQRERASERLYERLRGRYRVSVDDAGAKQGK